MWGHSSLQNRALNHYMSLNASMHACRHAGQALTNGVCGMLLFLVEEMVNSHATSVCHASVFSFFCSHKTEL